MLVYIRRKLLHSIPIIFAVTLLSFLSVNLLPGDVAETIAGIGTDNAVMDETVVQDIREDLGLDRPAVVRYLGWVTLYGANWANPTRQVNRYPKP